MSHRYLFVVWDGGGTIPPVLGLARRLVERGHRVTVMADAVVEPEARTAGAAFVPFTSAPNRTGRGKEHDPIQDWKTSSPLAMIGAMRDRLMCGPAPSYARDVAAEIARGGYDAVAAEGMLIGALIAAEGAHLPHAAVWPIFDIRPIAGRPPAGMGLRPATGLPGRLLHRALSSFFLRLMARGLPAVNEARAAAGLTPLDGHPFDQYARADRSLLLTSRHYDFPGPMLPNMRYVGPQLDDPTWAEAWAPPPGHTPLVLASLGTTFQNQGAVYARLLRALGALPVRGVVTLGEVLPVADLDPPAHVQVVPSAPHAAVFPHASLVVCHGGHGTTTKALFAGLPLVVVPLGRDQFDNAARVAHAGAGVIVKPSARASTLREAIARVLGDPSYRIAARRLADAMRAESQDDPAVREMEALPGLRSSPVTRRETAPETAGSRTTRC